MRTGGPVKHCTCNNIVDSHSVSYAPAFFLFARAFLFEPWLYKAVSRRKRAVSLIMVSGVLLLLLVVAVNCGAGQWPLLLKSVLRYKPVVALDLTSIQS